ncbi:XdhC family protein [Epilithonimonas sp. JDS]|uniref:XdhC family protein n=1 Tax=Epilithonimonas sp. JDS TaxID=2902797 RepID=UPI001E4F543B|nr:XdhC/CoxI family protein [Epilithonimonas sp. JDS]MCD9856678.1 XdhC family protein [Epilithonimonas sp. JDS]
MKEINDIVKAYREAKGNGLKTALATVVKVEGSSYRQPGARMLVTEDGQLTGAISGGCLEGDALKKAVLAIHQKNNKLITYDTSNPDDVKFGVQLGCNGIVHILFEYIDENAAQNPISLLEKTTEGRNESVITTIFSLEKKNTQIGTIASIINQEVTLLDPNTISETEVLNFSSQVFDGKKNVIKKASSNEILFQYIPPQTTLIIAGAGNDVKPLVETASILGWKIILADGRATHAQKKRFPKADEVLLATPEEIINKIEIDESSIFVLMTHNYNYDLALLKLIIYKPLKYVGLLGPKTKLDRMIEDMASSGMVIGNEELNKLFGPVGLDIGAETSEEIAISIVAEIQAVLNQRKGLSLRDKKEKIHTDIVSN